MSFLDVFFRQNDIRTNFIFHDIRLAMPLAYLGGEKTDFYSLCEYYTNIKYYTLKHFLNYEYKKD